MGLQSSAQSFQRLLDDVLRGLPNVFCYLDDVLVFSRNKTEHMKMLEDLFQRLDKAGLTLALDKCVFGQEKLEFLGFEFSHPGISPIHKKIEALQSFPTLSK